MKKLLFVLLVISNFAFAQTTNPLDFEKEYDDLLQHLTSENWENSEKLAKNLLAYVDARDSMDTEKMVLRYIYIYVTAGLMNEKKLSRAEALNRVIFLRSTEMIMPSHPFNSKCYVNCTSISESDKNTFFTGVNNNKGTQIFSFEYVKIKEGIKEPAELLEGKLISLKGILNEISVEGNILPRFKLIFTDGEYLIRE